MSQVIFKIGENDYSNHITVPSHQVNQLPEYESWDDANGVSHRTNHRTRIKGSFSVYFDDIASYEAFLDDIIDNTTADGYIVCDIYVVNLHTTVEDVQLYLDMQPANEIPFFGIKSISGWSITVEER